LFHSHADLRQLNVFLTFLGDSSKLVIESRVPVISMKLYRQDLKRKKYREYHSRFYIAHSNEILGWEGLGNRQLLCFFKA
jgi:hypothetical protein